MKLTKKHIECAEVCARLEIAGQGKQTMARECGVSRQTIYNWFQWDAFLAEKARALAVFRVDISDIPLTHRRDRIEALAGIANDPDQRSGDRIRAVKAISDEAAADVMGLIESLTEQIDLFERQMAGDIVALHRPTEEGKDAPRTPPPTSP